MDGAVYSVTRNAPARILELAAQAIASYKSFREGRLNFSELHGAIMQLEEIISSIESEDFDPIEVLGSFSPEIIADLNDASACCQIQMQSDFAQRVIKGEAVLADYPRVDQFAELVERELALLAGTKVQRALVVGSGPFPISAIQLHLQTALPVDCMALEPNTAETAGKVLERCGLAGRIRIAADARECTFSDYDVILVDVLAKPKKNILNTLRKRSRAGCKILCRTSHGLRQLLYEEVRERALRGFHRKSSQWAETGQTLSTWLLEPAVGAAGDVQLEWLRSIDRELGSELLALMNRTLKEETTIGFPGPIDEVAGQALMRQLNKDVESGHRHVLVAFKGPAIVGQLILTPNSSPNHRHIVELTRGTIDPSFRGGGLALRAFQEVARKCEELGREVICLDVRAGTHAAIWWQHFGFKQYGLLSDYSRVGDKKYQGLYLTQTTAELHQRLAELSSSHDQGSLQHSH